MQTIISWKDCFIWLVFAYQIIEIEGLNLQFCFSWQFLSSPKGKSQNKKCLLEELCRCHLVVLGSVCFVLSLWKDTVAVQIRHLRDSFCKPEAKINWKWNYFSEFTCEAVLRNWFRISHQRPGCALSHPSLLPSRTFGLYFRQHLEKQGLERQSTYKKVVVAH